MGLARPKNKKAEVAVLGENGRQEAGAVGGARLQRTLHSMAKRLHCFSSDEFSFPNPRQDGQGWKHLYHHHLGFFIGQSSAHRGVFILV